MTHDRPPLGSTSDGDDDYGTDIELDEELEAVLTHAESIAPMDIEDVVRLSPYEEFRRKGWLSVSDLVGTVWCEVQYDYRLRSLPYLPPDKRPAIITSNQGVSIPVDKIKVEDKERILRRGEKIHKRLEREIHPEEIRVEAVTREDIWGLRFLNMFSALEALLTLGKCRELPVVGFVNGVLIMGVIDEITREPLEKTTQPSTRSQTTLMSFFSTTTRPEKRARTHRLFISDSKTRASGTVPQESDTLAGRLQVMLYKELLDALLLPPRESDVSPEAILPTETPFQWGKIFSHLGLDAKSEFSDSFLVQCKPIIDGNSLRFDVVNGRTLEDMVESWYRYVDALGLGTPTAGKEKNTARTEDRLELVYRRAGAKPRRKKDAERKGQRKGRRSSLTEEDDLQRAIAASLQDARGSLIGDTQTEQVTSSIADGPGDQEEDELAWAVEMSLGATAETIDKEEQGEVVVRASQRSTVDSPSSGSVSPPPLETQDDVTSTSGSGSGSIIGRTVFTHSPRRLAAHLASVLDWWMGKREAVGVSIEETRRCGWCEFEEGCEWRNRKAQEATNKARERAGRASQVL